MKPARRFIRSLAICGCGFALVTSAMAQESIEGIPEKYEAMERQIVETLRDKTIWMDRDRRDTLMACLRAAEVLRSKAAVPILVRRIHIGQHWWDTLDTSALPEEIYPVQKTLPAIGQPAVQPILEAIKNLHRFVPEVLPVPDPENPGTLELVRSQRMATLSYTLHRIYDHPQAGEPSPPGTRRMAKRLAAARIRFEMERSSGKARENLRRVLETLGFRDLNDAPGEPESQGGGDGGRAGAVAEPPKPEASETRVKNHAEAKEALQRALANEALWTERDHKDELLGCLHAVRTLRLAALAPVLVAHIGFRPVYSRVSLEKPLDYKEAYEQLIEESLAVDGPPDGPTPPFDQQYPAGGALIAIGMPAVPCILDEMRRLEIPSLPPKTASETDQAKGMIRRRGR